MDRLERLQGISLLKATGCLNSTASKVNVLDSVLNRSKNSESIIGKVFDSIIDFKSIFKPELSTDVSNVCGLGTPSCPISRIVNPIKYYA